MLTQEQFEQWCTDFNLPPEGQALVSNIRDSEPARHVQSRRSNVVVRYASRKMGRVIQCESHTVELPLVYLLEHSSDALEFYDQPCKILLNYRTEEGRPGAFLHVPDFFAIYRGGAGFFECKPMAAMEDLARKAPWRFKRDHTGKWTCPPGEAVANPLGLFYRIWTPDEVSPVLIRNLKFLQDYLQPSK